MKSKVVKMEMNKEINLLKFLGTLTAGKILGAGSSRVVFSLPNSNLVLKLGCGHGGIHQNNREVELYEQYGEDYPLGRIIAAGKFCVLMENITPVSECYRDVDDLSEWTPEQLADEYEVDYDEAQDVIDAVSALDNINGYTSDNAQVGYNQLGQMVAYDYGFESGEGCTRQCSGEITDNVSRGSDFLRCYLEKCIECLIKDKTIAEVEDQYLQEVDKIDATRSF